VLVVATLLVASVPARLLIPNITGFLATAIPVAMAIGTTTGVNPMICGLAVMMPATPCCTIRRRAHRL
jgi:hypothetical protein